MKPQFTPENVPAGKHLRRMRGFSDVVVDIHIQGNRRVEVTPTGYRCDVRDNVGATYEPAEVAK